MSMQMTPKNPKARLTSETICVRSLETSCCC